MSQADDDGKKHKAGDYAGANFIEPIIQAAKRQAKRAVKTVIDAASAIGATGTAKRAAKQVIAKKAPRVTAKKSGAARTSGGKTASAQASSAKTASGKTASGKSASRKAKRRGGKGR